MEILNFSFYIHFRQFTPLLKPKDKLKSESNYQNEPLDKIMKTELIKDKNAEEIKVIWHEYHAQKDVICAVLPLPDFNTMMEEANKYPIFLFPLPRSQGYEFIMSQFSGCSVHFTPLICYQVYFLIFLILFDLFVYNDLYRFIKKTHQNV